MYKIKVANIRLIYLIVFLILLYASFLPVYEYISPSPSIFGRATRHYGYDFTFLPLIFYLVGVILIYLRRASISIVLTAIGNVILIVSYIAFLVEVATLTPGEGYRIEYGFFIIIFLLIVLIIINILMFKYKEELNFIPAPVQSISN